MHQIQPQLGPQESPPEPLLRDSADLGKTASTQQLSITQKDESPRSRASRSDELSGDQLIACLIAFAMAIVLLLWHLENIGNWIARWWRKTQRWNERRQNKEDSPSVVEPVVDGKLQWAALAPRRIQAESYPLVKDEGRLSQETLILEPNGHLESEIESSGSERRSQHSDGTLQQLDEALIEVDTLQQSIVDLKSQLANGNEEAFASFETQTESLKERLELAESELEMQTQQKLAAITRVEEFENETKLLKEQLNDSASLSMQLESSRQELVLRNTHIEELQTTLDETTNKAIEKASSQQDYQVQCQKLIHDLEESKQFENQTRAELKLAQESLELQTAKTNQAEQELETALKEISVKGGTGELLLKENSKLDSSLKKVESQLVASDDKAQQLVEAEQAIRAELQTETDLHKQTSQALNSATQEITDLQQFIETFQSESAQKEIADSVAATEKLNAALEEAALVKEAEIEEISNKLSLAYEEIETFKIEIADLDGNAGESKVRADILAEQLTQANSKTVDSDERIDALVAENRTLQVQLVSIAKELETVEALQLEHEGDLNEAESTATSLLNRAEIADEQLAESTKSHEQEQRLHAEIQEKLKEDNAELSAQVSSYLELEKDAKSFRQRAEEAERELTEIKELLEQDKSLQPQLEQTNERLTAELNLQASEHAKIQKELKEDNAELSAQVKSYFELEKDAKSFRQRAEDAERELTEIKELHEQDKSLQTELEQTNEQLTAELNLQASEHTKIQKELKEDNAELSSQVKSYFELEKDANSFRQRAEEAELELTEIKELHEQDKSLQTELEQTNERLTAELSLQTSEYSKLETELREVIESNSIKNQSEIKKLERQGIKLDELQIALEKARVQRSEFVEKLATSTTRINELEKQAAKSTINETNYNDLAKKAMTYKHGYLKKTALVEELSVQKSEMRELATEYLAAARILRGDLDTQLRITAELKQRLESATGNASNGQSDPNLKRMVQDQARKHVLALKSQFEDRIKEKNDLIRKLKNRDAIASTNGSAAGYQTGLENVPK